MACKKKKKVLCSVVDAEGQCLRVATVRKMCQMHYMRWREHGSPLVKKTPGPKVRFTDEEVQKIFAARATGETYASIAKRYGVSRQRIFRIVKKHSS